MPNETFARLVRRKRLELSMSVEELAEAAGVQRVAVWKWEKGVSKPHPRNARALAAALGMPIRELAEYLK